MKRRIITLTLVVYVACLLQSTLLEYIEIVGIRPNLLLVLAVAIALLRSDMESAFMGLVLGIGMDVLIGRAIGWYGLCLFLVCFGIGRINPKLYKENPLIPIFFVFFSSVAVELFYYLINFFIRGYQDFIFMTTTLVIPESIYNAVLALPIYPVVLRIYKRLDRYERVHNRI